MTNEEKIKLFEEKMYLVDRCYRSKYAYRDKLNNEDDAKQEGALGLWRSIDKGRALNEDGTLDEGKAFMSIYCDMGAYFRRKVSLDPRVKRNKDITFTSLNAIISGTDGIELQEVVLETSRDAETVIIEEWEYNNFFEFFKNIDKNCKLQTKLYDTLLLKSEGFTSAEVGRKLGVNQSTISKRLKMAYNLYKDAYA